MIKLFNGILTGLMVFLLASTQASRAADPAFPGKTWTHSSAEEMGLQTSSLNKARDYALKGGGSGIVTRSGVLVLSWGDLKQRYDLKSTTKSIGVTALGLAILDGKMALDDQVLKHHPQFGAPPDSNVDTGWLDQITIRHLATQTAGFEKPGGYKKLIFKPGEKWSYSDGGPNWLAECVTRAYQQDVNDLLFERVFAPLGIEQRDLSWRNNAYRPTQMDGVPRREFGSGVSANVDAMARLGLLYLRGGMWNGRRILPAEFVKQVSTTDPAVVGLPEVDPKHYGNASDHYGLLWWNNADGAIAEAPRDAFWSWGLHESLIVVIPSLDLVAARAGGGWTRAEGIDYEVLRPFLAALAQSASNPAVEVPPERQAVPLEQKTPVRKAATAPYPPSTVITGIEWAPASEIVRRARGSDNWPITWGDDDAQYTAYGDGNGFKPYVEKKLSLGLARVVGGPTDFTAANLRSPSLEQRGNDVQGKKASGLLMVDGVLYLFARNAANSQLAWSHDRGRTWTWSKWKFTESFGYPTFLNFGRNYSGARDEYVYVYSHDQDSAYRPADRMVLARVKTEEITERDKYEFFAGLEADGQPKWSADIAARAGVFQHPGRCYRSGATYNAALKRYLWVQIIPGGPTRFVGGFGVYDAPEPWGPWSTVYFSEAWDVGPGETGTMPTKWMSADGRTVHLVFSGDDHFSVRQAKLRVAN